MTRLQKHYKKRFFWYTAIIIAVVIFLSTIGLNFAINSSSFLSNLFGKRDITDRRNVQIQDLQIDSIPEATNNAQIKISGIAFNFDTIEFFLNDSKVRTVSPDPDSTFEEEIGPLQKGENEIYFIARAKKEKKKSEVFRVTYLADKPKLEITEPSDNSATSRDEIKVAGKTDKEIQIKINDLPTVVDASGNFQAFVKLKEGENKIKITATDAANNTEEKTLTVKYERD